MQERESEMRWWVDNGRKGGMGEGGGGRKREFPRSEGREGGQAEDPGEWEFRVGFTPREALSCRGFRGSRALEL